MNKEQFKKLALLGISGGIMLTGAQAQATDLVSGNAIARAGCGHSGSGCGHKGGASCNGNGAGCGHKGGASCNSNGAGYRTQNNNGCNHRTSSRCGNHGCNHYRPEQSNNQVAEYDVPEEMKNPMNGSNNMPMNDKKGQHGCNGKGQHGCNGNGNGFETPKKPEELGMSYSDQMDQQRNQTFQQNGSMTEADFFEMLDPEARQMYGTFDEANRNKAFEMSKEDNFQNPSEAVRKTYDQINPKESSMRNRRRSSSRNW